MMNWVESFHHHRRRVLFLGLCAVVSMILLYEGGNELFGADYGPFRHIWKRVSGPAAKITQTRQEHSRDLQGKNGTNLYNKREIGSKHVSNKASKANVTTGFKIHSTKGSKTVSTTKTSEDSTAKGETKNAQDNNKDKNTFKEKGTKDHSTEKGSRGATKGASACLLLRDENHLLAEWMAYHYHVLPLRHLVVSIDPTSLTDPTEILERWTKDKGGDFQPIDLVMWDDSDFYDGHETKGHELHLDRQHRFVKKCVEHHREMNRTWVILTDPDEFVTLNMLHENEPDTTNTAIKFVSDETLRSWSDVYQQYVDDAINYTTKELKTQRPEIYKRRMTRMKARRSRLGSLDISKLGKNFTLMDVMNESPWSDGTCIMIPRLLFTNQESPKYVVTKSHAAKYGMDPWKLRTLRYFHHDNKKYGWWGKAVVDASRMEEWESHWKPNNIHSPYPSCGWLIPKYEESILRIHHYIGSWKEYSYKGDCRRTWETFQVNARRSDETNYVARSWLEGFMENVGTSFGQTLLKGAGDIPSVNVSADKCIEVLI